MRTAARMALGLALAGGIAGVSAWLPRGPARAEWAPRAPGETAMFAAGCYWQAEASFRKLPGVLDTAVGYASEAAPAGGACSPSDGPLEVVRVRFDPAALPYETLVRAFLSIHDPTRPAHADGRLGDDGLPLARSVIYTSGPEQRSTAEWVLSRVRASCGAGESPVLTRVEDAGAFTAAGEDQQRYLERRGWDRKAMPRVPPLP